MDVRQIDQEPSNKLIKDYLNQNPKLLSFFDYSYQDPASYNLRAEELQGKRFQREALVNVLTEFNERYTKNERVFENIGKLSDPESVAVVGGQQAGLLTGPAFSIHKCLSVIKLAKRQEKLLGIPVVPIFWIAGEDHDLDEVNHVFVEQNGFLKKKVYESIPANKRPVSHMPVDHHQMEKWVKDVFHNYGETQFSQKLIADTMEKLNQSESYVDFFAGLIHYLFEKEGIVLMDSAAPAIRKLEKDYFYRLLDNNEAINESVKGQLKQMEEMNYLVDLDQSDGQSNLFYDDGEGRVLLERDANHYIHPITNETYSIEKIREEATDLKLSNNVVTRPIMQDLLLPVLAFIAGPGEISYWSALKGAFHVMDLSMPIILPRLHFTIIDRQSVKWLNEKSVDIQELFQDKIQNIKENWLEAEHAYPVKKVIDQFRSNLTEIHQPLTELMKDIDSGHQSFAEKNLLIMLDHVDRYEKKANQLIEARYAVELKRFDHIEKMIQPMNAPQERKWTIFYFLNKYGLDLIEQLLETDADFNGKQHVIIM